VSNGGHRRLLTGIDLRVVRPQILDAEGACKLAVYLHGTDGVDIDGSGRRGSGALSIRHRSRRGDAVLELRRGGTGKEGEVGRQ